MLVPLVRHEIEGTDPNKGAGSLLSRVTRQACWDHAAGGTALDTRELLQPGCWGLNKQMRQGPNSCKRISVAPDTR